MNGHRIAELKPMSLEIPFEAGAVDVVAGSGKAQQAAARRIAAALSRRCGAEVPVVGDAAYAGWDVRPERHAVLVGSLGDNRAIEYLYYRWLTFADSAYPGRGGHLLTTVWDPWGAGTNALVAGASDGEGLEAAAGRLEAILAGGGRALPRLYEVVYGPAWTKEREAAARWAERGPTPDGWVYDWAGFGGLSHIPAAGWAYLRSGDERIAEGVKKGLLGLVDSPVLHTRESQLHLGFWGPMMLWSTLETSPVFSDAERLKIVRFLYDVMDSEEGYRNHGLIRMAETELPRQNHQTFCALALAFGCAYFDRHYRLEETRDWRARVDRLFRIGAYCSKTICDNNAHAWYTIGHFATYALLTGNTAFFDSGMARLAADRAVANCSSNGFVAGVGDGGVNSYPYWFLAQAAFRLKDPGFRFVAEHVADEIAPARCPLEDSLNADNDLFLWQQSYDAGEKTEPPSDHVGVRVLPLDRLYYDIPKHSPGLCVIRDPNVPHRETFDKLTMRSGWERTDQHLILDGVGGGSHTYEDANAILMLTQDDRFLLISADYLYYVAPRDHNMVTVTRNGLGGALPSFCRLDGKADLPTFGYTATTLPDYVGTDWTRTILWRKGDFFLVADRLRARERAEFSGTCRWFSLGRPELSDGTCVFHQAEWRGSRTDFVVRNLSGQSLRTREAFYGPTYSWRAGFDPKLGGQLRSDRTLLTELDQAQGGTLEAGEAMRFVNLLYARSGGRVGERLDARTGGSGWSLLRTPEGSFAVHLSEGVPVQSAGLRATCEALAAWREGVFAGSCTALKVGGLSLIFSAPCGVEVSSRGRIVADAPADLSVLWRAPDGASGELELEAKTIREWEVGPLPLPDPESLVGAETPVEPSAPYIRSGTEAPRPDWRSRGTGRINALQIAPMEEGDLVLAACEGGALRAFSPDGREAWTFETGSPVNTVHAGILRKGESPRIVLGCEDEYVRALDAADRRELWRYRPDYGNQYWAYWSWYRSSIKRVFVDDLDGDGHGEVIVTPGNMRLHLVDADGKERWVYRTDHGTFLTYETADLDGDGLKEIVGGCDLLASSSVCRVIGADGRQRHAFGNAGWTSQVKDVLIADLDDDGEPEVVCAVSREENLRVHGFAEKARRWGHCLGEVPVGLALLRGTGGKALLAATEGATALGFGGTGGILWRLDVSPGASRVVRLGDSAAVLCADGRILRIREDGRSDLVGRFRAPATAAAFSGGRLFVGGEDGDVAAYRTEG